ncbi:MAG: transporter substrate-binding domain-containing protein, partial [Bacilli bacterium]
MKTIAKILVVVALLAPSRPISASASTITVAWTSQESAYIEQHPTLTLAVDPEFVPFEFIEGGEYKGIASDYVKIVEQRTGIDFQVVPSLTWEQAYARALNGDIDVMAALSKTTSREQYVSFSDMYYEVKRVIVTRNDNTTIKGVEDLFGRIVAVQKDSSHHSFLLGYPEINLSTYLSVSDALTAVADGREMAFVGNLATSDYLIKSSGLTNLRFTTIPSAQAIGIHFAVSLEHEDQLVLLGILNKSLRSMSDAEKIAINSKWVTVDTAVNYGPIIQTIISVVAILLATGLVSGFWIVKLRREVAVRKEAQIELEEAKVFAEEANAVKSSFMARMSHEIRTPLNAITGMSYLIKKSSNITPAQRMYADRITQASQTMLGLLNDVLDYSKIEAAKVELEITTFSLDQVVHNLMSIIAIKIEDKGLGFKFSKDTAVPTWFKGDPKRLEQVLLNLLNNAVKFTEKGEIVFEIHQKAREDNLHHLTFSIKDTGIGMSKETVEQLFTPFTQADSSITRRYGGTGLGLSIVKSLVELMGGTVRVYSSEGQGSTFLVELSLLEDSEKQKSEFDEKSHAFIRNLRVLVVDKNTSNLNMIETYLHSFGIPSELTTSPNAALALLEEANGTLKKPFDLLIVDYDTPIEKGLEFVSQIKHNLLLKKTPKVIMLLPMQRSDLFDQLQDNQVDIGIGKPVISSILHNAIIEIFIQQTLASQDDSYEALKQVEHLDRTILVVDDNATNQLIAKLLLEGSGFHVLIANNGAEGVKVYRDNADKIDLVLMDIHMPIMDGFAASKKIIALNPQAILIAMTAEVTRGVKESCKAAGISHYLAKPFEPEHFVKTVRDVLSKKGLDIDYKKIPLDIKRGMKQLGDNKDLYTLVVKEFFRENQDTAQEVSQALKHEDYPLARQHLHKIKGSCSAIGALDLNAAIFQLLTFIINGVF